jgi:sugar/nucleoside kinase (ribokinase family)
MEIFKKNYDVTGIGSALLDFMVSVDDDFLSSLGLNKGGMHLIDEERSREIFRKIKDYKLTVVPGGSSANTVAGISALGGKGAFIGRVADDDNGRIYVQQTIESGVKSCISPGQGITGHAITFITPDLERTFATHLGAALELSPEDVDLAVVENSSVLHLEGYLFEADNLMEVCFKAMDAAKGSGTLVSVDLADPGLIDRAGPVLNSIVNNNADIVFANESEALKFTGFQEEKALENLGSRTSFAVVKLGPRGSLIKTGNKNFVIPPYNVDVVNTNGAGDMYAAGVLYGLTNGIDPEKSGKIGSYAASLVVASPGARYAGKIDISDII